MKSVKAFSRVTLVVAITVSAVLLCTSCHPSGGFDEAFLESSEVCLKVSGEDVFVYDPLTCQMAFSSASNTYRVFNDTGSEFFSVELGAAPTQERQKIKDCSVSWTTDKGVENKTGQTCEVRRMDAGGMVWLWFQSAKIYALVQNVAL